MTWLPDGSCSTLYSAPSVVNGTSMSLVMWCGATGPEYLSLNSIVRLPWLFRLWTFHGPSTTPQRAEVP